MRPWTEPEHIIRIPLDPTEFDDINIDYSQGSTVFSVTLDRMELIAPPDECAEGIIKYHLTETETSKLNVGTVKIQLRGILDGYNVASKVRVVSVDEILKGGDLS